MNLLPFFFTLVFSLSFFVAFSVVRPSSILLCFFSSHCFICQPLVLKYFQIIFVCLCGTCVGQRIKREKQKTVPNVPQRGNEIRILCKQIKEQVFPGQREKKKFFFFLFFCCCCFVPLEVPLLFALCCCFDHPFSFLKFKHWNKSEPSYFSSTVPFINILLTI